MASSLTYVGYTSGHGTGETHPNPTNPGDLQGFTTAYQATGPGTPGSQGTQYALCFKRFGWAGYPNNLPNWNPSSLEGQMAANNGGVPLLILYATGGGPPTPTPPSATKLEQVFGSLPAGQALGFVWISEAEANTDFTSSASGAADFVSTMHTFSLNLNTALTFMQTHPVAGNPSGTSFYNRTNFPLMNSALMSHYQTNPGDTAWIPNFGDVDAYGADLYHKGSQTNNHCLADPRFSGYVQGVRNKLTTVQFNQTKWAFPEYGINLAGIGTEQARANLMQADYNDMTGANAPGQGLFLWNYWYQIGNSGETYPFPVPGSETEAAAGPTLSVWHGIVSSVTGSQNVNVFGVTADVQTRAQSPSSFGGAFFVRSMSGATTPTSSNTITVLKDPNTRPGDLIQIWVTTNSGTGITWSCPGFTAVPAVS